MKLSDFEPIDFGQPLPPQKHDAVIKALWKRRSCSALTLTAPGPTADEMDLLLALGLRVPDHGKIGPWRIVRFSPESKSALVTQLEALADTQADPAKARMALQKLSRPPEAVMVVSSPLQPHKIPLWEQQLSAAAVCQNLLIAVAAIGYGANWITDWYSYDPKSRSLLGLSEQEQIAGFIYIGTPSEPPLERDRPDMAMRLSWWLEAG